MRIQDLTPDDPDVRHLEALGLVEWRDGKLHATPAGERVLKEEFVNAG